jgi:NlpC/P60 family
MTISSAAFIAEVESLAKQAGDKYYYGGTNPSTGFDCSGLIYDALIQLGVSNPPRTSEAQYAYVDKVNASQLEPGDLVFAQFPGDNSSPGHVGIYIGGGNIFSAQDPQLGIGISTLTSWAGNIVGYGRVPSVATSGQQTDASGGSATATLDSSLTGIAFPGQITGFFGDAKTFIDALLWLVNPASWLRIGSFWIGVVLLLIAAYAFISVGQEGPMFKVPQVMPVPV